MATRYLLPCTCGKTTPVEVSQAGETLTCACGNALKVPTLRGLKELPLADEEPRAGRPAEKAVDWSAARGALFSLSLLVFVVASLTAAINFYAWRRIDIAGLRERLVQFDDEQFAGLDNAPPLAVLEYWTHEASVGLAEGMDPTIRQIMADSDFHLYWSKAAGITAAIAGAIALLSLLARKPARAAS